MSDLLPAHSLNQPENLCMYLYTETIILASVQKKLQMFFQLEIFIVFTV